MRRSGSGRAPTCRPCGAAPGRGSRRQHAALRGSRPLLLLVSFPRGSRSTGPAAVGALDAGEGRAFAAALA
eukprot:9160987-Alexandrium_andersonii.AAC.1